VRLTDEVKKYWKIFRGECDVMLRSGGFSKVVAEEQIPMVDAVLKAFDTIEALQQENNGWRERYDELDAGHSRLFKDFCKLQAENEQLQAQVARMREALTIANNYMPDVGQFCACGKCKTCGADINYAGYEHCVKCARAIIDAALSDTPADYHNPADVEALIMAMEAIKAAWSDGSANAAMDKASEALAEIDKAIGGKEDAGKK
jgi:FtsZ-binding cell division protein ZapB